MHERGCREDHQAKARKYQFWNFDHGKNVVNRLQLVNRDHVTKLPYDAVEKPLETVVCPLLLGTPNVKVTGLAWLYAQGPC